MTPSSGSLSSTSLPFRADAHTDATLRSSDSVPRSVHHEYRTAVYGRDTQTHSALIPDAQAIDAVSGIPSIQMPPSSAINPSKSHKKVVRQHRKLFWVLIGIFSISLVASTVAVVLGAVKGHQHGHSGTKGAAIVVGVIGFLGMVGSAVVILTRRKERARLEKRWADEEKPKEERSFRELQTGNHLRESIRNRNRSLSRSCSRGRGRGRDRVPKPIGGKLPSFRAMTTTPTSSTRMPDHNAWPMSRRVRSPWPGPMDVSNDINDSLDDENHYENVCNHDDNEEETENCRGHDKGHQARDTSNRRVSASTQFHDLDSLDSENEDNDKAKTQTVSQPDTAILEQEVLSEVARTSPTLLNTSPTYTISSPMKPHPAAPRPYDSPRLPPIEHAPFDTDTVRSSDVGIDNTRGDDDTPPGILRWQNRSRDSAQSDENLQAMLDLADDVGQ